MIKPQIAFISTQTCLAEAIKFENAFDPVTELSTPTRLDSVDSNVDASSEVPMSEQRRYESGFPASTAMTIRPARMRESKQRAHLKAILWS
jgi:hypothetical protein